MSEYVKDKNKAIGWKMVSYSGRGKKKDDGAPVTAEGMDEEGDNAGDGDEGPDDGVDMDRLMCKL